MRTVTAKDAKSNFGQLIDMARATPVAITKYERPVVVVLAVEEYEWLKAVEAPRPTPAGRRKARK